MLSRHRWCEWCRIGPILPLNVMAVLFVATLSVQSASLSTNFSFPVFPAVDELIFFEDSTRYNPGTLSFTIDPIPFSLSGRRLSCVKLYYKDKVLMKSRDSSSLATFSTSFTFSITQGDQSTNRTGYGSRLPYGFMFTFAFSLYSTQANPGTSALKYFDVEFDTYYDYITDDPSDNHIGVNINNTKSAYTHNLCEGNRTSCSFPWTGRTYTAWIDYNGSMRSLEVWFANGSLREGVLKPAGSGLIKVTGLDLMDIFEDHMYIGFSGNVHQFLRDTIEVLSWNSASSYSEALPAPTSIQSWRFSKKKSLIVFCVACGSAIVAVICLLGYWSIRQPHITKSEPGLRLDLLMGLRRFSFKELKKATKNFSEGALLGKGGSGSVYKGTLTPSGLVVAVKRLKHDSEHVQREFLAEVSSISQIRHRNFVHLQGWCYEDGHFLLVFDYMSNGSLDEWICPSRRRHPHDPKYKGFEVLPWEMRFSILAGIAAAVEYLHEVQCVLHRDIKSSNVLLDENFNPHLGDFGLAQLMDHGKLEKTTMMAGTFGYMAPEMHYTGKATKESDVYSFGILMLEVLCGRRPVNLQVEDPDEDFMLVQNVWRAHEGGNILSAVDPGLKCSGSSTAALTQITRLTNSTCEREPINEVRFNRSTVFSTRAPVNFGEERRVVPLLQLGLRCCLSDPESRSSMRVVKQVIMQVQSSTAEEDPILTFERMPPLPSAMPLLGDLFAWGSSFREPFASIAAAKAAYEEVDTGGLPEMSRHGEVRRRFVTN